MKLSSEAESLTSLPGEEAAALAPVVGYDTSRTELGNYSSLEALGAGKGSSMEINPGNHRVYN